MFAGAALVEGLCSEGTKMRTQSVLVAAVVGVVAFLSLAQGAGAAVITYLNSERFVRAQAVRVDAMGFGDFDQELSLPGGLGGTTRATQRSQLLDDRILAQCFAQTQAEFPVPAGSLSGISSVNVTFRITEPTEYALYSGPFLQETLVSTVTAVVFGGPGLNVPIASVQMQGPPISGLLPAGDYRFQVIASATSQSGLLGRGQAVAGLILPAPTTALVLVGPAMLLVRVRIRSGVS